jgi:hypothetical protein
MSGLTVVQTTSNVASAIGAWTTFMQTLVAYKNGTASQGDVRLAPAGRTGGVEQLSGGANLD